MTPERVDVLVGIGGGDVLAGTLRFYERRGQSTTFEYDRAYLSDARSYPLDPALPLGAGVFQPPAGKALFNTFTDSAPDRWGQNLMRRNEQERGRAFKTTPRSLGPVDFLLGTRDELRQGSTRLRDPATGSYLAEDPVGVPELAQLGQLLNASDRVGSAQSVDRAIRDLIAAGSSLGGARPKAAVRKPDGTLALAKFPRAEGDDWDVELWEMIENELARARGNRCHACRTDPGWQPQCPAGRPFRSSWLQTDGLRKRCSRCSRRQMATTGATSRSRKCSRRSRTCRATS